MSSQSLLARLGLRSATLGSAASLAIAAPLAEGDMSQAAHTDATRIGVFFDRTAAAEGIVLNVLGTNRAKASVLGFDILTGRLSIVDAASQSSVAGVLGLGIAPDTATFLNLGLATTVRSSLRIGQGVRPTSAVEGDVWNDIAQQAFTIHTAGRNQNLSTVVFTSIATATVGNSVVETSLIGAGIGSVNLPANFLVPGKTIRITVRGIISATGLPTMNFRVKLGSTVLCTTGAFSSVDTVSNNEFIAQASIVCRTSGATGTFMAAGEAHFDNALKTGSFAGMANTGLITVDTTGTLTVGVTIQWGTADPGNTISGQTCTVEVLN